MRVSARVPWAGPPSRTKVPVSAMARAQAVKAASAASAASVALGGRQGVGRSGGTATGALPRMVAAVSAISGSLVLWTVALYSDVRLAKRATSSVVPLVP